MATQRMRSWTGTRHEVSEKVDETDNVFRGLLNALPISIVLWALLWLVLRD